MMAAGQVVPDPGTANRTKGNRAGIIIVEVIPEEGKAGAEEKGGEMGVVVEKVEAAEVLVAAAINLDRFGIPGTRSRIKKTIRVMSPNS